MSRIHTLIAGHDSNERADRYLYAVLEDQEDFPQISRSRIQQLIEEGLIQVNGNRIRTKDTIPPGASITIELPDPVEISVEPENIPVEILYEDSHLVVVNKPAGLTVHPSETQKSGTLVNALLFHIKDLSGIGGKLRPGIVHRIDKDTSGALVVSKTDEAHAGLSKLFATHDIERRYWALCYGSPAWSGPHSFESTIGRSPSDRKKMAVNVEGGRKAVSHFTLLESYSEAGRNAFASLIEAKLETGRTHQVRVHLNHLHHSLLGDPTYGTPSSGQNKWKNLPEPIRDGVEKLTGQALHARVLGFIHPVTKQTLHFEASAPLEFQSLLNELKKYS
jgi:23S rRNA pseudouridine1911/1915/1917 synthase